MWDRVTDFLGMEVLGMTVGDMVGAFFAILAGFVGKHLITFLLKRLELAVARSRTALDDILISALSKPLQWASVLVGIYVACMLIPFPTEPVDVSRFIFALLKGSSVLLLVWFAIRFSDGLFEHWKIKAQGTQTKLDDQAIPIVQRTMRVFLFILGGSLFLQNLGYSVGSLFAGLGLGGAALALASKDTLSNLFGAIVIFWDRPFEVGDWIEMSGIEGTVEEVGLRTTRVRTFANSLITMPNASLTTQAVNNWSRMKKRRIKMTIGLTYDSGPEKMRQAVAEIKALIESYDDFHHDFYLVNFNGFGSSSLDIFVYCFTKTTVWAEFMAAQERFLLDIMTRFQALGLSFAFPTTTVHLVDDNPGDRLGR